MASEEEKNKLKKQIELKGFLSALDKISDWCWENEKKISSKLPDEYSSKLPDEYLNGFYCCCDEIRTELIPELKQEAEE